MTPRHLQFRAGRNRAAIRLLEIGSTFLSLLAPAYDRLSSSLASRGLGRYTVLRRANALLHALLRPKVARVLGHHMFLDSLDTLKLAQNGVYEPLETALVTALVKPRSVVVDIGAHVGYYTLLFARLAGDEGRILAFEPEPQNFSRLARNVRINGYRNVTLFRSAVSDQGGPLSLYISDTNKGDHHIYATEEPRRSIHIRAVCLDDHVREYAGRIDLIKMDIQGAEGRALRGMQAILKTCNQLTLITEFWPYGLSAAGTPPREYLELLLALGFNIYEIDESHELISPTTPSALLDRPLREEDYTNLLATKDPGVPDRLWAIQGMPR